MQGGEGCGGEDRGDSSRVRRHFERDVGELCGLVAEHDQVGPLRHFGVRAERLAPDLADQRLRALTDGVRHEHRAVPPARERPRHVACAYQSDLRREASRREPLAETGIRAEGECLPASVKDAVSEVCASTRASEDAEMRRLSRRRLSRLSFG